jgi:TRAP-type C4-dicarboxylate transport system permease small subunit
LLLEAVPGSARWAARAAIALSFALLYAIVAREATLIALDQWDEQMMSFDLSAGWFLVPVVIGGMLSAVFFVSQTVGRSPQGASLSCWCSSVPPLPACHSLGHSVSAPSPA